MDISDRIKSRMRHLELKGVDLTRKTGVSSGGVSQWVNGITKPNGEKLIALAKALQCDPAWLTHGIESKVMFTDPGGGTFYAPLSHGLVPLISQVQAGGWTAIPESSFREAPEKWRETTAKVSDESFALKVVGDSMVNPHGSPSIPEGSIVIVDPSVQPDNGSIVVARLEDTNEATLKKLVVDGPHKYLMPLNPKYSPITINGNCKIVGVVKKVEFDL